MPVQFSCPSWIGPAGKSLLVGPVTPVTPNRPLQLDRRAGCGRSRRTTSCHFGPWSACRSSCRRRADQLKSTACALPAAAGARGSRTGGGPSQMRCDELMVGPFLHLSAPATGGRRSPGNRPVGAATRSGTPSGRAISGQRRSRRAMSRPITASPATSSADSGSGTLATTMLPHCTWSISMPPEEFLMKIDLMPPA